MKTTQENKTSNGKFEKITISAMVILGLIMLAGFVSGCSDSSITSPGSPGADDNISVSSMVISNTADNPSAIVITEAKALIREVELEGPGGSREIRNADFVLNFDMAGNIKTILSTKLLAGNYTKIKFQIHKPEDFETPPDPEFKEGNSGNQRFSFIIKGTYNGSPFVYKSRKSANLIISLTNGIDLQSAKINLTMLINKLQWFNNGGGEVNPTNSSNDDIIDDNIKNSFGSIFKDDNRDGHPDDN